MAPSKMIRQRSVLADNVVYGISVEVKSQPNQSRGEDGRAISPSRFSGPSASHQPNASSLSPPVSAGLLWRHRAENLLWLVSAAFIIYYGDFRSSFFSLILNDPRVRRTPLHLGFACLIFVIAIVLYLALRLQTMVRIDKRLDAIAPDAIPVATAFGMAAFILFSVALWPIWNILTVPMLFTLFMALLVVVVPYVPSSMNVNVEANSLHYICVRCE